MPNKILPWAFFVLGSIVFMVVGMFLGIPWYIGLIASMIIQLFVGDIVYKVLATKNLQKIRESEEAIAKSFEKQYAEVKCPCDRNAKQIVQLNLNEENLYNCNECDKKLKALVGWKSFQVTTPLDKNPFEKFNFVENKDYDV